MKILLLTSMLIFQSGVVYADRETEQFVSLFLHQMTKSNEHEHPLEKLEFISPRFLTDAKIKPHFTELDNIPFDHFVILSSSGPYVDYQIDSDGCTGCKHKFRVKVGKHNNDYVVIPSGHTVSDKYYIQWWWSKID